MNKIISVIGPTASGKTKLSVALAKKYNAEIVSVDSMQIYREMNIGTAKITPDEMQGIPHYMIDCFWPTEVCSVSKFVALARNYVDDILSRNKNCVLAGGTGLYVDHLIQDTQFVDMPSDPSLRSQLNNHSCEELMSRLQAMDPRAAARLHLNDKKRIVRALEVILLTGKSILYWEEQSHVGSSPLPAIMIGLNFTDREYLYERINQRVDLMLEQGLEREVIALKEYPGFVGSTASEGIGYKEILRYLDGEISLQESVDLIKQSTRRYAKRQITWFKRNPLVNWIDVDRYTAFSEVLEQSFRIIERNGK
ncbi:MAG: tRNA (adenosine(37)-N6)-dimethylallyltransferase MiaA [Clostridia bacterium]|nr:tRNA (adenosine(37)-N6)-dimethylallyltransferase MiaA [Clostridia bacterium]